MQEWRDILYKERENVFEDKIVLEDEDENLVEPQKVMMVRRQFELEDDIFLGLIYQTKSRVYFYDASSNKLTDLVDDPELEVKLEVIRGLNDDFYFVVKDKRSSSDSLRKLSITSEENADCLKPSIDTVPAPFSGEILALELDPAHTNDLKTHEEGD